MGELLGQGQRLLTPLHGLVGIAQAPQVQGRIDQAPHPRHHALAEHLGTLRRQVGEGNPCCQCVQAAAYSPRRTRSPRVRHAPPGRASGRPHAGPTGRAVPRAPAPSATPHGCDRTAINPAGPERAGTSRPPVGTRSGRGRRSAPPLGWHSPWSPSMPVPGAREYRAPAECVRGSPAVSLRSARRPGQDGRDFVRGIALSSILRGLVQIPHARVEHPGRAQSARPVPPRSRAPGCHKQLPTGRQGGDAGCMRRPTPCAHTPPADRARG